MSPKNATTSSSPSGPASDDGRRQEVGDLDKVRNLLFGPALQAIERRVDQLEARIHDRVAKQRDDLLQLLATLESATGRSLAAIAKQLEDGLAGEAGARAEGHESLAKELRDLAQRLELSIGDLQRQTEERTAALAAEAAARHDDLTGLVGQQGEALRTEKASRADLASLFSTLALRLQSPESES